MRPARLLAAALCLSSGLWLTACGGVGHTATPYDVPSASAQAERTKLLAAALPMPDESQYRAHYLDWHDEARQRVVPAKLYLPAAASAASPVPLVVVSHGLGGSREGYSYLGKYLAAHGIAALHLHHVGSDRSVWRGQVWSLLDRLRDAAQESEAVNRALDVRFGLDRLAGTEFAGALDLERIAIVGHSYGANTALLVAGAEVQRMADGSAFTISLREPRVRAAVMLSAPPFHGETDAPSILKPITVPNLHVTTLEDDIRIPGYRSGAQERIAVYDAMGAGKSLVVFKRGSHSVFTDRLNTSGADINPEVKAATRELVLDFLQQTLAADQGTASFDLSAWERRHHDLVDRVRQR